MSIVGLYSPAPQCGKTTVAGLLHGWGYQCVSFAEPLKQMTVLLLRNLGYSDDAAQHMVRDDKAAMVPEIGVTVRHMLQTLGTEYGRQCLHEDIWLKSWEHRTKRVIASGGNVVVDDMRFPNEAELIRRYGGDLWCITRPGYSDTSGHASEGGLAGIEFDRVIVNDGSLDDLRGMVLQ